MIVAPGYTPSSAFPASSILYLSAPYRAIVDMAGHLVHQRWFSAFSFNALLSSTIANVSIAQ
jgi:hypothetical protein